MAAKNNPSSIGEAIALASHQVEIDARLQSYAVATEITKNVITRFGSHEPANLVPYWTAIADGVYGKIKADMEKLLK